VSAGTLMVFAVVALALIWKRIVRPKASFADNAKAYTMMGLLTGCCIGKRRVTYMLYESGTSAAMFALEQSPVGEIEAQALAPPKCNTHFQTVLQSVVAMHAFSTTHASKLLLLLLLLGPPAAFACIYGMYNGMPYVIGIAVTGGLSVLCCIAIHVMCPQYDRPSYRVPFFPYLPGASLLLNSFLMVSHCCAAAAAAAASCKVRAIIVLKPQPELLVLVDGGFRWHL
jgi:hypothetical protein